MSKRREFLKSAGAVGAAGLLAGCLGGDEGEGTTSPSGSNQTGEDGSTSTGDGTNSTSQEPGTTTGSSGEADSIMFALTPAEGDVRIEEQYKPMFEYLESEANVTVESTVAADYTAVLQALDAGQADFADSSPSIALKGGQDGVTEVTGIRVAYGADKYFSLLYTMADSGIEQTADLEGTSVAFADRISTSGSIFPLFMLKEAGLDIGNAPKGQPGNFSGTWSDHAAATQALETREEVKAAGTGAFVAADYIPKDQFPQQFLDISAEADGAGSKTGEKEYRLLECSDPIPRAPIVHRADLDSGVKSRVSEALLSATEEDLVLEDADEPLWFTGVKEGSVEDYQPVKDAFDAIPSATL
ncbi:substrate-binding domain-containing protein [Halomarina rubra]|uniref:Substrate-binding domain-containing protein n=1 Tax=Halomarina rubra TaxID=2071873 RepID=A0ABD6AUK4_9EURY|nr:substrate-binding domain-containing protein [Halomarina rubra]